MSGTGGVAAAQLRSIVERVERLEEEKREIAEQIKGGYAEAKSNGFVPTIIKNIIKKRKLTQAERDEFDALMDIYSAALGMLDGTPLGEAALKRLEELHKPKPKKPAPGGGAGDDLADALDSAKEPAEKPVWHNFDEAAARALGAEHCKADKPVTANPFPARDPRRAAYDEGWCQEAGSDGMDIPEAWRRTKKKADDGDKVVNFPRSVESAADEPAESEASESETEDA